jgi:hypothetical protein
MRPDPHSSESDAYIGNVLENTFDEVWFGSVAESVRSETIEGRLHAMCRCPGCPFTTMNSPYPKERIIYNEYPTFLEIDLPNTHCNVGGLRPDPVTSPACVMCERASPHFRPEVNRLPAVLERIKHVVPNLEGIHVQGIAEPFYQTRKDGYLLFEVLDSLDFDVHSQRITLSLTTNGTIFKKSVRQEYLNRVPRSITNFSIDASTRETFKSIRILDCFEQVIDNFYAFSRERDPTRQALRLHCNVNTMNVKEVVGLVRIAHEAKVNSIEFNPTNGFNHPIIVNEENCGSFVKAQRDIVEECDRLDVPCQFLRPLDLGLSERLIQITL